MACDYCQKEKTIFETEAMGLEGPWTFEPEKLASRKDYDAFTFRLGIWIDSRGYLRMADLDDCNCLDSGEKIKIAFCPMCGEKIDQYCQKEI
jgi:hypothetical protein